MKHPTPYQSPSYSEQDGAWLRGLAEKQTRVTFQLLSRRVIDLSSLLTRAQNRQSFGHAFLDTTQDSFSADTVQGDVDDFDKKQTAICKVNYKPGAVLFRKDMALSLVQYGRAEVTSGMHVELPGRRTTDGSSKLDDLNADGAYMDQLSNAEYVAIQGRKGLWADDYVREMKNDFIKDILAEENLSVLTRLWNWITKRRTW